MFGVSSPRAFDAALGGGGGGPFGPGSSGGLDPFAEPQPTFANLHFTVTMSL
jgi:hypothetical protein